TYRGGRKLPLQARADAFVARANAEQLEQLGVAGAEPLSPHSARIVADAHDLPLLKQQASQAVTVQEAYYTAGGEEFLATDRIFVTFRDALPAQEVDAFAGQYGLLLKQKFSDRDYLFQLTTHSGRDAVALVVELSERNSLVAAAENDLNYRMQAYQYAEPSDPYYARQWHLHTHLADAAFDPRASARCEDAWRALGHYGLPEVVVGVTDDGCKLDHGDFDSDRKFAGWGYFAGERLVVREDIDADPRLMYVAGANHGTSCAGVIAGEADAVLTVGAAPGCCLLPVRWESSGPALFISDSKLLTALNYMADKVDIVSNSWGSSPVSEFATPVLNRIAELSLSGGRRGLGIVFLWAAGNENCPIVHEAAQDVPFDSGWRYHADGSGTWVGVRTARQFRHNLAALPGVMYVAALASNGQRSHYSNYGTGIALCAPSSNLHLYRRATVTGLGITTASGSSAAVTASFGGTSSATPLVAGVAALAISANPSLTAAQVISVLKRTAAKDLNLAPYARTPGAVYDPQPRWDVSPVAPFDQGGFANTGSADGSWSPWFGHGRVDAPSAVAEAQRLGGASPPGATLRRQSTREQRIPDNSAAGVADQLSFDGQALVGAIKVVLDISHPYIGDLAVTLQSPAGASMLLHNRNGGGTANLQRAFDVGTTPALAAAVGQPVAGAWTLRVQDLAAEDTGTLNRWSIDIVPQADTLLTLQEAPGLAMPDNDAAGIERSLTTAASGQVADLAVAVDITHSYIGDLKVTLVAPNGAQCVLHNRGGGSADNLIRTYTPATVSALAALRGTPCQGTWRLRVADLESRDVGKLNRWEVKIRRN
ncbi:MAG TPA: proprotein convertase P-domain-containing protein, partial [Pseudoduganella sp.]